MDLGVVDMDRIARTDLASRFGMEHRSHRCSVPSGPHLPEKLLGTFNGLLITYLWISGHGGREPSCWSFTTAHSPFRKAITSAALQRQSISGIHPRLPTAPHVCFSFPRILLRRCCPSLRSELTVVTASLQCRKSPNAFGGSAMS